MRPVLIFILLLLTASCQRTVRTEYHYLPPASPDQQACVERCNQTDRDCLGSPTTEPRPLRAPAKSEPAVDTEKARRDYDECTKRVQSQYEQCQIATRAGQARGTCYRPVCVVQPGVLPVGAGDTSAPASSDEQACGRIFRSCFERCGGKVETREVCEGNCY